MAFRLKPVVWIITEGIPLSKMKTFGSIYTRKQNSQLLGALYDRPYSAIFCATRQTFDLVGRQVHFLTQHVHITQTHW
jgi:hypothetical protein